MTALQDPPTPITSPGNPIIQTWPSLGLTLIHDFITPEEEATLIDSFHRSTATSPVLSDTPTSVPTKKVKRLSQHFGHHFDYQTFGASSSTYTPIPPHIASIISRLPLRRRKHLLNHHNHDNHQQEEETPQTQEEITNPNSNHNHHDTNEETDNDPTPDQLTLQYYPPGAGIPPHVDTHSMFGEALYSLSFGPGAVPMVFKLAGENEARKLRLPKRSLEYSNVDSGGEFGGEFGGGVGVGSGVGGTDGVSGEGSDVVPMVPTMSGDENKVSNGGNGSQAEDGDETTKKGGDADGSTKTDSLTDSNRKGAEVDEIKKWTEEEKDTRTQKTQEKYQEEAKETQETKKEKEEEQLPWELWLPSRSLLIMTGPSRYGYTHGIKGRKTDLLDGKPVQRQGRYSITMRSVRPREEIGCDCAYPGMCDARVREEERVREKEGRSR